MQKDKEMKNNEPKPSEFVIDNQYPYFLGRLQPESSSMEKTMICRNKLQEQHSKPKINWLLLTKN